MNERTYCDPGVLLSSAWRVITLDQFLNQRVKSIRDNWNNSHNYHNILNSKLFPGIEFFYLLSTWKLTLLICLSRLLLKNHPRHLICWTLRGVRNIFPEKRFKTYFSFRVLYTSTLKNDYNVNVYVHILGIKLFYFNLPKEPMLSHHS